MNARKVALAALTNERSAAVPELGQFVREVERELSTGVDQGFWKCSGAFRTLARSEFLRTLVNHELNKFLGDALYVPLMSFASQVVIAETDLFQLSVGFVNARTAPATGRLQSLPTHCMLTIVDATSLPIAEYEQERPKPDDTLNREAKLQFRGKRVWQPGDFIEVRAGHDIVEFQPQAGATSVVLNFSCAPVLDYIWEYDRESLAPVRIVPSDATASRIEYATQVFAKMGDPEYLPALVNLSRHPAHFVRWSAIRAAVELDYETGLKLLEAARSDPHRHVRNAAERTLTKFEAAQTAAR